MNPKLKAKIEKRKIRIYELANLNEYLDTLDGKEVFVTIERWTEKKQRSNQQNRYMWSVPYAIIAEYTGNSPEEVHELMCQMFNSKVVVIKNKEYRIPLSTASLSTIQLEEYLSRVREWASIELSLYVPLPNEVSFEEQ